MDKRAAPKGMYRGDASMPHPYPHVLDDPRKELLRVRDALEQNIPLGAEQYRAARARVRAAIADERRTLEALGYRWPRVIADTDDIDRARYANRDSVRIGDLRRALLRRTERAGDAAWSAQVARRFRNRDLRAAAAAAVAAADTASATTAAAAAAATAVGVDEGDDDDYEGDDADQGALMVRILGELERRRFEDACAYVPDLQWYSEAYTQDWLVNAHTRAYERALVREATDAVSVGWRIMAMAAYGIGAGEAAGANGGGGGDDDDGAPDALPDPKRFAERWRWDVLAVARLRLSEGAGGGGGGGGGAYRGQVATATEEARPYALLNSVGFP